MKILKNQKKFSYMSSRTYTERCLTIYKQILGEPQLKRVHSPLEHKNHPKLDELCFLDDKKTS